ncbi:MAG: thiamine pyrophosphate-dependent enzyme [Candidatus Woesearchaeota archaeon]
MPFNIRQVAEKKSKFVSGHRSCTGCAFPNIVRTVLKATDDPVVVCCATGCLEVVSTIFPQSSWNVPYIHNVFGASASTMSGVEAAWKALHKKGKAADNAKFVVFAGDGGSYDIGLQALSGMMERGHDVLYVLYDNEAYANTGNQRSSATPFGAATTTSPVGSVHKGKQEFRKDITRVAVAHNIPYVAQASCGHLPDLFNKAEKAFSIKGPKFLNVLSTCTLNWKHDPSMTIEVAKKAVSSCFWPLYEVENGVYKLSHKPSSKIPVEEFLKMQGRYRHFLLEENRELLEKLQRNVDEEWGKLLRFCGEG